jgi:ATP-dependent helicase/nuclease subunit A
MTPPDHEWPEYAAASEGQRLAALPDHSAWVEANAGSGKTKVLIDRVAPKNASNPAPFFASPTPAAASECSPPVPRLGGWCNGRGSASRPCPT